MGWIKLLNVHCVIIYLVVCRRKIHLKHIYKTYFFGKCADFFFFFTQMFCSHSPFLVQYCMLWKLAFYCVVFCLCSESWSWVWLSSRGTLTPPPTAARLPCTCVTSSSSCACGSLRLLPQRKPRTHPPRRNASEPKPDGAELCIYSNQLPPSFSYVSDPHYMGAEGAHWGWGGLFQQVDTRSSLKLLISGHCWKRRKLTSRSAHWCVRGQTGCGRRDEQ